MKHIFLLVVAFALTLVTPASMQASKNLSVYKDGFVTARVPVAEIDSMNFSDLTPPLTLDEYLAMPEDIADMLVDLAVSGSTSHDVEGLMAVLHATDLMGEDMVMDGTSWFYYDYCHENRLYNYWRTNIIWRYFMEVVKSANKVIETAPEGLLAAYRADTMGQGPSTAVKALGQAYAYRAFAYYYLVQLFQYTAYQDVPANLSLPTVPLLYAPNEPLYGQRTAAMPASVVLKQIEDDLLMAKSMLVAYRLNKTEINTYVVNGLLARYYLLIGAWDKAYEAATEVVWGYNIMPADELEDGFMDINNQEWIWGYDFTEERGISYPSFFSHISNLTHGYAGMNYSSKLIDARLYDQIPATDGRKRWFQSSTNYIDATQRAHASASSWKNDYANLKFGWKDEWAMDYCYMRASEMVLIQAEALARQGKEAEAAAALAVLMANRDASWNKASVTVDDVLLQRRIELWGEGFAYFDLKRTNKGIDRTYQGSNHPSALVVPANDERWYYQLPEVAYTDYPALNVADKLPQLKPIAPVAISGTQVAFSFELEPFDTLANCQMGIVYSLDPAFEKGKTKVYTTNMVGTTVQDTLRNLKTNTTYYAKYVYTSSNGIVYSTLFSFVTPSAVQPSVSVRVDSLWASGFNVAASYQFEGMSMSVLFKGFEVAFDAAFEQGLKRVTVDAPDFSKTYSPVFGDTVYFVRAFVTTVDGTTYSQSLTVNTLPADSVGALSRYVGTYLMQDYGEGDVLDAEYSVELIEKPNDPTCLLLRNFWDGGKDIEIGFDLGDMTVSIDNNQVILNHSIYGPVYAYPVIDGDLIYNEPVMGTIESDSLIRLGSWGAAVEAGYFGLYEYSTLRRKAPAATNVQAARAQMARLSVPAKRERELVKGGGAPASPAKLLDDRSALQREAFAE